MTRKSLGGGGRENLTDAMIETTIGMMSEYETSQKFTIKIWMILDDWLKTIKVNDRITKFKTSELPTRNLPRPLIWLGVGFLNVTGAELG